ncbi:MAG: YiiX/YebB-like N1pC/P60 family cysteine hydrolase [Pseudohongiellaceae bacterium]
MFNKVKRAIGSKLASFLSKALPGYRRIDTVSVADMVAVLQTGDIVLVEGNTRISSAIKYLTQSSWSHAALYVGEKGDNPNQPNLLEADLQDGVRLVKVDYYDGFNLRICRPVNLTDEDVSNLVSFAKGKLGHQYDLKNVFDLTRYLIQKPAVPARYRRAMIGFGSGEPTKAICSTLIAETFQSINYPILPLRSREEPLSIEQQKTATDVIEQGEDGEVPQFYRRHFTHFTPRDFDLSPYFRVVKPTIESGFDHHHLVFESDK